ncbi:MAG TPA: hypothetical protein VF725_14360 [Ktedonobacterales bacterium]
MWQFALAPFGALFNSHPLMSGLGGVITVIVGGIASAIALRSAKRGAARPAASPEAAPARQRPAPPISYGAPAPPTSPSRRLHPGPISLRPSTPQAEPPNDEAEPGMSHFKPDILTAAPDETYTAPLWPTRGGAKPRVQTGAATPEPDSMPAPVWTSPRTRGSRPADHASEASLTMEAPIWSASLLSARLRLANATNTPPDGPEAPEAPDALAEPPMIAPVWTTRARLVRTEARARMSEVAPAEAEAGEDDGIEPPIWPSRARRPT